MTICAVYARKSTEQERGETGDSLSVEEQIDGAKAFIASKGWTVGPIFKDEAVSGWTVALEDRPGGRALLDAARAKKFDVLVMRNESRLGREMADALTSLVALTRAGIKVFYYATGQEVTLRTAKDKLVASIGHFGAEDYAERVSSDTRRGKLKRAREGHWQGGEVFGYRRVETLGPNGKRLYVDLEKDPAQADTVRTVFEMIAQGHGLRRVSREVHRPVTTLRHMLDNPLYRGVLRYEGRKDDGSCEVAEITKPELEVVSEALWKAAHARLARTRQTYTGRRKSDGTLHGRPESGLVSRHLLAGHLRCGVCGGSLFYAPRISKSGKPRAYWLCTNHHKQGAKSCTNRFALPYEKINDTVLGHFKDLTLDVLVKLHADEWDRRRQELEAARANRDAVEADVRRLDGELTRLADAVAAGGGDVRALVDALKRKQAQRDERAALLEHLDGVAQGADPDADDDWWLAWVAPRLDGLKASLDADPTTGRAVVRDLLREPIIITPEMDEQGRLLAWSYVGRGYLDRVLAGRLPEDRPAKPGRMSFNNPQSLCATGG